MGLSRLHMRLSFLHLSAGGFTESLSNQHSMIIRYWPVRVDIDFLRRYIHMRFAFFNSGRSNSVPDVQPKFFQVSAIVPAIKRQIIVSAGAAIVPLSLSLPASASSSTPGAGDVTAGLESVAISTEMLKPVVDGVAANLAVIIPIGIALFAILLGVTLIPKVIKKFLS